MPCHVLNTVFIRLSDAAIEVTEADVSCWRSVRKLEINHSVFAHIKGLDALQEGMTHLRYSSRTPASLGRAWHALFLLRNH